MSHVPHLPSERFLHPWFPHLGPWPKMGPVPRCVFGYRTAPWGTVMQPTCHMFLIHLVEDCCAFGFPTWGVGKRWGVPRWVSGYRADPGESNATNMSHLVENFYALGFPTWCLGARCHPPTGGTVIGLGLYAPLGGCCNGSRAIGPPPGGSDATNLTHVPHPPCGKFLRPWFPHLVSRSKMPPPTGGTVIGLGLYAPPWGTP